MDKAVLRLLVKSLIFRIQSDCIQSKSCKNEKA